MKQGLRVHIFSELSNLVQTDKNMNYKFPLVHWYAFVLLATLLLAAVVVQNGFTASAFSGSGEGTTNAPYLISTCEHLQEIALDKDANYILTQDIDCSNTTSWNDGAGFAPIHNFIGSLDGRNHTITGLYINRPSDYAVGLFGFADGAIIKNIRFANSLATTGQVAITGRQNVGAVAGELRYNAVLSNIHSELSVQSSPAGTSGSLTGGLVGISRGNISRSSSSGTVIANVPDSGGVYATAGGLVGYTDTWEGGVGHVQDSYATGTVRLANTETTYPGTANCGGLIGSISYPATVQRSYSSGDVNCPANDGSAGGFIGILITSGTTEVQVENNFATGSVTGPWGGRGFIGWTDSDTTDISSNYYDATQTGQTTCVGEQESGCNAVNTDGSDQDYFKNPDNFPFPNWDQGSVWTIGPDMPVFKEVQISPDPPTNLNAIRETDITLNWEAPIPLEGRSNNINDYKIEYKLPTDTAWTVYDDGVSALTSATVSGIDDESTYIFRIQAVNDIGAGLYSASLQVSPDAPTQVVGLTGEANARSASLSWEATERTASYKTQYKASSDSEWSEGISLGEASDTSRAIYGLNPGVAYEFRVAAVNGGGQGPWSEVLELATTQQQSYTIATCQELQDIQNDPSGIYTLANDINCSDTVNWNSGKGFLPIDVFIGTLKGNGHTIDSIYMNTQIIGSPQDTFHGVGLFGVVMDANITNVRLQNTTLIASFALDETVDADQDGIPDDVQLPTSPEEIQQLLAGGQEEILARLGSIAGVVGNFGKVGAGTMAGLVLGGTYQDITSNNAAVIGGEAGGIFGIVTPFSLQAQLGGASAPFTESAPITMSRLSSSGAVNGVVSGGLIGLILSGISNDINVPQVKVQDSSSTATVDGNVSGGLAGVAVSIMEILSLVQTQNPAEIPEKVSSALSTYDIEIKDSSAKGNVSTCNTITQVPIGSLGGVLGAGVGVQLKGTKASGSVTACASNADEIGVYGGALGGLAGSLLASRIDDSHASGRVGGVQPLTGPRPDERLRIFAGASGGLTGIFISTGDQNNRPVISSSSSTGPVRNDGGNGLFAFNGGFSGIYIGSGTIKDSHSKSVVENKLPQDHYFGASISGGLLGLSVGIDVNPILSMVFGKGLIPSRGIVVNNSYATGDVKTTNSSGGVFASISGGMGGMILGHASIINSHATGNVSSNMSDGLHINVENPFQTQGNSLAISGGLLGFAAGIDQNQILTTVAGAEPKDGDGILINNVYAAGNVKGTIGGGLIGYAELRTRINKTYAEGKVRGTIVGGLVGSSGAGATAGLAGASAVLSSITDPDGIPAMVMPLIQKGAEMVSPLVITNTYTTGDIAAVPLSVKVTQGNSPGPVAPFELPTMAGGVVGLYASPAGKVEDSYASGKITVANDTTLEAALPEQVKIPRISNMVGGIFGVAVAMPQPDMAQILAGAIDRDNPPPLEAYFKTPMIVKDVFAVSELRVPDKTLVGGVAGLFGSPLSAAFQDSVPANKFYDIDNIYFDESQIRVSGCNGPRKPEMFFNELFEGLEVPDEAVEAGTLPPLPEDSPVNIVLPFFKVANCNSVNKANTTPAYFKNNKVNPPLDKWDFDKTWVVKEEDYPKFVAGAHTSTPVDPPTPTVPTTPSIPTGTTTTGTRRLPPSGFGAGSPIDLDTTETAGRLDNFMTNRFGNVSEKLAKLIPYILLLLLVALALLYTYLSILEDNRRKRLQALVTRFKESQIARSVYLKLTSHFINTPITEMRTAVELLTGLKQLDGQVAGVVQEQLKLLGGNAQMLLSAAQELSQAQESSLQKVQAIKIPSLVRKPAVWVPVAVTVTLALFANILFVQIDKYEPSVINFATQVALAVVGVVALVISCYFLEQSKHITATVRAQHDLEKSVFDQQNYLIHSIASSLDRETQELKKYEKEIAGKPKGTIFTDGLKDLEYLTSRFDKLSQLSKHVPGLSWSTNVSLVAQKALADVAHYAEQARITINSSIDSTVHANVDTDSLYHILYSSLENAVKYSKPESQVALVVGAQREYAIIEVQDHGKGISKENIVRLFQPFSRISPVEQFDDQGIGLDLYFSKVIVENYGGSIVLVSQEGQGTTAKIRLPQSRKPAKK